MSRRTVALSMAVAALVLGGAGAFAVTHTGDRSPALRNTTVRYTAPTADRDGSLVLTTEVTASSGVQSLKVLAWPEAGAFAESAPTEKEMTEVESATCAPAGDDTARCTYKVPVTPEEAADSPSGPWHIATLATAEDGATAFSAKTARFTVA
ncbi:DUF5707 domain-containing protein [Streptomyces abyssomicinicus]|uniref:DUF5707 domain-containing protein n=1 Tax=Streptomyces abyssomicinicus TaxID=574929 RepID=UPI00124FD410|nr:DUF5707 domain-containing protein [Streptomyces abyssomicinicus]